MFNLFKSKKLPPVVEPVQKLVVPVEGQSRIPVPLVLLSNLRRRVTSQAAGEQTAKRGMWVIYQNRVGILQNLETGDVATVMLVDEKGHNSLEIHTQAADLRQAWYEEIPEARRPEYPLAAKFGYHQRPQ